MKLYLLVSICIISEYKIKIEVLIFVYQKNVTNIREDALVNKVFLYIYLFCN